MDSITLSHQAAVKCWESLTWLANVSGAFPDLQSDFEGETEKILIGLKNSVGILRDNYLTYHNCFSAVDAHWIKSSREVVSACGKSGRSGHHLVYTLSGQTLAIIVMLTRSGLSAANADPEKITLDSLPNVAKALNYLVYEEMLALWEYMKREENAVLADGPWSKRNTPKQWAQVFGVSVSTIKRRFKDGSIRNERHSDRSYSVHVDDVPENKKQ